MGEKITLWSWVSFRGSLTFVVLWACIFSWLIAACFIFINLFFYGHYVSFYFILFFNFTMLYWFCHISTWIRHRYTRVPHPEPSSFLPPCTCLFLKSLFKSLRYSHFEVFWNTFESIVCNFIFSKSVALFCPLVHSSLPGVLLYSGCLHLAPCISFKRRFYIGSFGFLHSKNIGENLSNPSWTSRWLGVTEVIFVWLPLIFSMCTASVFIAFFHK